MRPERVHGISCTFANEENAKTFFAYAEKLTKPYAAFVELKLVGTEVSVCFKTDSVGEEITEGILAQLLAMASTLA